MSDLRDAYVQKLNAKINEWNADIDKLVAKADGATADVRIEYSKQIENLRAKRATLGEQIENLRQAGEGAWEDLKTGVESASDALGEAVRAAIARFR